MLRAGGPARSRYRRGREVEPAPGRDAPGVAPLVPHSTDPVALACWGPAPLGTGDPSFRSSALGRVVADAPRTTASIVAPQPCSQIQVGLPEVPRTGYEEEFSTDRRKSGQERRKQQSQTSSRRRATAVAGCTVQGRRLGLYRVCISCVWSSAHSPAPGSRGPYQHEHLRASKRGCCIQTAERSWCYLQCPDSLFSTAMSRSESLVCVRISCVWSCAHSPASSSRGPSHHEHLRTSKRVAAV